jgi:hypothetical protein
VVLALLPGQAAGASYRDEVVADSPRAYWRLGETSGTNAVDQTGNGNTGTYLGGPSLDQPGALAGDPNPAVGLDGSNDAVRAPNATSLSPTGGLSLEAWVKPAALPSSSATLVRKEGQYLLRLGSAGQVTFRLWKGGAIHELVTGSGAVAASSWSHVVAAWDGSTMTIYVDGTARASGSLAGPIDTTSELLFLGASFGDYDFLAGGLDEVAVYAAALPPARVAAHWNSGRALTAPVVTLRTPRSGATTGPTPVFSGLAGTTAADSATIEVSLFKGSAATGTPLQTLNAPRQATGGYIATSPVLSAGTYTAVAEQTRSGGGTGRSPAITFTVGGVARPFRDEVLADSPRAYWRLGESSGASAADQTTNRNTGTYLGGPSLGQGGALTGDSNAAVALDGANDTIRASSSASLSPVWGMALEAWIRPTTMPASNATIIRKNGQYQLRITSGGRAIFRLWKGGVAYDLGTVPGLVTTASWTHLVGSWDGSTMTVYVNGVARASRSLSARSDGSTGEPLYLGSSSGGGEFLSGRLDEVAIYGAGLSPTRVAAHWDAGKQTYQRLMAAGDIAGCDTTGDSATASVLDRLSGPVVPLGDLAYEDGSAAEFADCYHPTWGRHKWRTYPVVGGHEYRTPGAAPYFDYFGSAAGDRSRGYYSYNLGSWHVVALNTVCSEIGGCGAGSPQEQWLRRDLASNRATCVLALLHDPRFSSGSIHGSDDEFQALWQALYDHDADLVLSASEHHYERFARQTPEGEADPARGLHQIVVGTGGRSHYPFGTTQPNSELRHSGTFGVIRLTLHSRGYAWQFVPEAGKSFTDSGIDSCH